MAMVSVFSVQEPSALRQVADHLHDAADYLPAYGRCPQCRLTLVDLRNTFHLRTSVYLLRTLIPSFAHDSAYFHTFFTPHLN